jgi:hypothetical protein
MVKEVYKKHNFVVSKAVVMIVINDDVALNMKLVEFFF